MACCRWIRRAVALPHAALDRSRSWSGVGAAAVLALAFSALAPSTQSPPAPRFDVVSVKLDVPYGAGVRNGPRPKQCGFVSPDTWTCGRMPVSLVFRLAFGVQDNEIVGMPAWTDDVTVDIDAKLPPGAPHSQVPQMLQAMFADRFQLLTHRATQVIEVRHVTIARGGVKLRPATRPCTDDPNVPHMPECCVNPAYVLCAAGRGMRGMDCSNPPVPRCGDVARGSDPANPTTGRLYSGVGATMADIIRLLNAETSGRPFADHTGLQGRYDFSVTVALPPYPSAADAAGSASSMADSMADWEAVVVSNTERAWREQTGLDVDHEKTYKEPYPVLVVDRIARPSAN